MTVSEVARALMELVNEDPEDEHIDVIFNVVYKDYDKDKFDKALRAIP
jgi:hypothetical protein